jgi:hypothetical protein
MLYGDVLGYEVMPLEEQWQELDTKKAMYNDIVLSPFSLVSSPISNQSHLHALDNG